VVVHRITRFRAGRSPCLERRGKLGPRSFPRADCDTCASYDSSYTPGLHSAGGLGTNDIVNAIREAVQSKVRILPLPMLAPPKYDSSSCSRARQRVKQKLILYRIAVAAVAGLNWAYSSPKQHKGVSRLCEMPECHRSAWVAILVEAKRMREARRSGCSTGSAALTTILKRPVAYDSTVNHTSYVPIVADLMAEPSQPYRTVNMLEKLPPDMSEFYSCETNVVAEGGKDPEEIAHLNSIANNIHPNSHTYLEYVRYLQRPDTAPLYMWVPDGDQSSCCAFKAVKKSNGALRKILATLVANYKLGPVRRSQSLGLYGGASIGSIILDHDSMYTAIFDQENAFSYIVVPIWLALHQALPKVRASEIGSHITGLNVPGDCWIRPCYLRLAMGSTHSVDIIIAINRHSVGCALIASFWYHERCVFEASGLAVCSWPQQGKGFALELFSGTGRWLQAMAEQGFGSFTGIEINEDIRLDLQNPMFLEVIARLAKSKLVQVIHSGTPCSSLTSAITPPWRSSQFPSGIPGLTAEAQRKVDIGNKLSDITMFLLNLFHTFGALVSDENPAGSFHWSLPSVTALYDGPLQFDVVFPYCPYGTPWRKYTRIRANYHFIVQLKQQCTCTSPHQTLRGKVLHNGKWINTTSLASPYPWPLVHEWARVVATNVDNSFNHPFCVEARHAPETKDSKRNDLGVSLNDAPLGSERLITNGTARYSHIDDHLTVACSSDPVRTSSRQWAECLQKTGFVIKEMPVVSSVERYIGYSSQVTPARWQIPLVTICNIEMALLYLTQQKTIKVQTLRAIIGFLVWLFLLRRNLLSIFHRVYDILKECSDDEFVPMAGGIFQELVAARRLLLFSYADTARRVFPIVGAQDAEGESNTSLGGWGLGVAAPSPHSVVSTALKYLSRTIPKDIPSLGAEVDAGPPVRVDDYIPQEWTDSSTYWHDILARAHSYPEHITQYEAKVLVRLTEILAKLPFTRRSYVLTLEDNQAVVGAMSRGRSPSYPLNQSCRRKMAIELASDVIFLVAWISTHRMPMDKLSRERIIRN
jgi:hypothetical protein